MNWVAVFIIVAVLGVIIGNVMLLKYSAKMKFKNTTVEKIDELLEKTEKNNQKNS